MAIVIRSIGTDYHRNPHTGVQTFADGVRPIPAGALPLPDAEQLQRILKRGKPVTMHLTLVSQTGRGQSGNVIAEVPGRDPKLPPILVGGHLDSWDQGTGAIDDAAGVAIATAAAKRIMDAGRPLRTIRVVWFGAEEPGLFGGIAYKNKHGREPHYASGRERLRRGPRLAGQQQARQGARGGSARDLRRRWRRSASCPARSTMPTARTSSPMIAAGVPAVGLSQDGTYYFDVHHTPDDTLDKVDPEQLRQNVAAWTAMLAVLSGGIEPEPKRAKRR